MKKKEVSPTAAPFHVYKSFWSVLRKQALETHQLGFPDLNGRTSCWTGPSPKPSPEPCWTSLGSAPKPSRPSLEPCWTWPGSAQNLPDLLRNFFRNPVEPDLALHQTFPDLHLSILRNPVEPDLALHQSLPHLLRNPIERNITEPCPEPCPGSAPKPPRPSPEPSPAPSWAWAWPSSAPKPPRPSPEPWLGFAPKPPRPSPEPSPAPCWTWPGPAPKPSRPSLLSLTWLCTRASQTFSGTLLNLTWLCSKASRNLRRNPALHQSFLDLHRNFLRNPVEPDPAPAPVHTGAILGWRPH